MGEKGNISDVAEGIFENLASQGPQFWIEYEQYKLTRGKTAKEHVISQGAAQDPAAGQPQGPAIG
jgi:hypothetical protein